jgi:hypothetical protein
MIIISSHTEINFPKINCPKCDGHVTIEEVDHWEQAEDETWQASKVYLSCTNEPDMCGDEWDDWFEWHYDMPYTDWLPLCQQVKTWINTHYRWSHEE